ncbi:hypothetical protein [Nitratireductor thuwali]|uniref:Transcriptional regulator n=1 Tax=Nitratireductor thuwali TaxID=2267699 RepID=A0ABY5MMJ1_9HYPH|nr:hypothetical protein NTH_03499 [Nitratireductor thuwali]
MAQQATKSEDKRADQAHLVDEYRKVGPAAINAALQCCSKAKPQKARSDKPRQ